MLLGLPATGFANKIISKGTRIVTCNLPVDAMNVAEHRVV